MEDPKLFPDGDDECCCDVCLGIDDEADFDPIEGPDPDRADDFAECAECRGECDGCAVPDSDEVDAFAFALQALFPEAQVLIVRIR